MFIWNKIISHIKSAQFAESAETKNHTRKTDVISPNYQILLVISTNFNDFVSLRIQSSKKVTK